MPYKSESIPIAGTKLDQRRKLSNEQREAVKILADKGYSQRKLAEMFNVSKSLVQSILNPQQRSVQKKRSLLIGQKLKENIDKENINYIKQEN